ncbi:thioredoxin family protein [Mariniplasma anaerobium]|uniref:Redox-active disulfide protein 2 n=1 Tax=Mariniplasma anaerobium TaxID=2735436 RepID=A0A7U9XW63_9MOLU|nr:thioredoxin family protein [Mariniplasma anaerobium]BCR36491.1 redox-active disulfide protein 2 [Mariniplasma anaerobium]
MEIKVLGSGCPKCKLLEKNVVDTLKTLGKEAKVEKVTDYAEIAKYNVMSTPALVVDGKVVLTGRVPNPVELAKLLK